MANGNAHQRRQTLEEPPKLFDVETKHEEHWKGMPEFSQKAREPYAMLIVRFGDQQDLDEFAKLIEQTITKKTKSIWYPKLDRDIWNKEYVDEST